MDYHLLINYMKELRLFFHKEYDTVFKLGSIYQGNPDYSYFSLTTEELKKQKLKFVIILSHKVLSFEICLSGQNKNIRRKYWQMFRDSDWDKYQLAESIDESLMIVKHTIVKDPDFSDARALTELIEKESFMFMDQIKVLLED